MTILNMTMTMRKVTPTGVLRKRRRRSRKAATDAMERTKTRVTCERKKLLETMDSQRPLEFLENVYVIQIVSSMESTN